MFIELCARTHYSFLRGASAPGELVRRAMELGMPAIGITDLNGVYGIPKAYHGAKNHPGFKLITGSELTFRAHPRIALLACDRTGYGLMCRLLTASHAGKPKGEASIEWEEFTTLVQSHPGRTGLIAIPRSLPALGEAQPPHPGNSPALGNSDAAAGFGAQARAPRPAPAPSPSPSHLPGAGARRICEPPTPHDLGALKDLFGDRLYLPVSRFLDAHDADHLREVRRLSLRFDIPLLATNDVHYHIRERRKLQDVLTAIREGVTLKDAGYRLFQNGERYLKSAAEMATLFKDLPEALTHTLDAAARCTFSPSELRYRYPSEWIPTGETAQSHLEKLVYQGALKRYGGVIPEDVEKQLRHELSLIGQLQFADYFLTIWEIVEFARSRDILCQGRGSAANSAVCYCLGITAIDPVRMNLLFERFISAERGEPPDIDVDFEHERREEVIQHIYEKYGRDRAAMVSALITYRRKSAVREVSKIFGNELSKRQYEKVAATTSSTNPMDKMIDEIEDCPRHLSIHSGGFTLSADPMIEIVPVEPARMEGRTIVQWDKYDLDTLGLLKIDVLSLGMLTAIKKALVLTGLNDLAAIPPEDPATYLMIQRADTVGVFQIESRAQMAMLPKMLPKNYYDLVVEVALVRPGPIVGGMVHPYLRRRRGLEPVTLPHPALEPILGRTLGVPIFQEQVMKMAIALGGFTPGEADELRRAIGAWRSSGSIDKMGRKLMDGLLGNGLPREFVEMVFKQIHGFAEYGFPESHSASFALLVYASAYLKCHHPAAFACALLNSQPMGFYSGPSPVDDARRHGVRILPLDPNVSEWDCTLEPTSHSQPALRLGWRLVHGAARVEVDALIAERKQRSFATLTDFLSRTRLKPGVLHRLALGGAFACLGYHRRDALWEILAQEPMLRAQLAVQLNLFSTLDSKPAPANQFARLDPLERIGADYAAYGASAAGHPMQAVRHRWPKLTPLTTARARQASNGKIITAAGMAIVLQRPPTAKGTVFSTLEDEHGFLDLIFHAEVYQKFQETVLSHCFVIIRGRAQRDERAFAVIVSDVQPIFEEAAPGESQNHRMAAGHPRAIAHAPIPVTPNTSYWFSR